VDFLSDNEESEAAAHSVPWPVLVADDDEAVLQLTRLLFSRVTFDGRPIEILTARSGRETREVLARRTDIAVVILDIVMEMEDAGIETAKWIRSQPALKNLRIIIRSGQPGQLDERALIHNLDIQDYWSKTELTSMRMRSRLSLQLRAFTETSSNNPPDASSWLVHAGHTVLDSARLVQALAHVIADSRGAVLPLDGGGCGVLFPGEEDLPLHAILKCWDSTSSEMDAPRWYISLIDQGLSAVSQDQSSAPPRGEGLFLSPRVSQAQQLQSEGWHNIGSTAEPKLRCWAYASTYSGDNLAQHVDQIARSSATNNVRLDLSGVLFVIGTHFIQFLEGPADGVAEISHRVQRDPRNTHIQTLLDTTIEERSYSSWGLRVFELKSDGQSQEILDELLACARRTECTVRSLSLALENAISQATARQRHE
jgi:CheY-like chemotaxis protein